MSNFPYTINRVISLATDQINKISVGEMDKKPSADSWSKKEILGHLIDSAYNNHQRFLLAGTKNDLIFSGYDQPVWVANNAYQKRDSSEILHLWITVNMHLSSLIAHLPEWLLSRKTTRHNFHEICFNLLKKGSSSSLSYLIWDYIDHMEHHLAQIIDGYEKINESS